MSNNQDIIIRLGEEHSSITTTHTDGTVSTKNVDTSSLCQALGSQVVISNVEVPPYCRMIAQSGSRFGYLFIYPPQVRKSIITWNNGHTSGLGGFTDCKPTDDEIELIKRGISDPKTSVDYIKDHYRVFNIPYPALAVITVVNKSGMEGPSGSNIRYTLAYQYVMALKNHTLPISKTDYYRYPFTNVFGDDRCCLGHGYADSVNNVDGIAYFPSLIFNGIGNADLTSTDMRSYAKINEASLRFGNVKGEFDLMSKIHNLPEFPSEYLLKENVDPNKLSHKFKYIMGNM